MISTQVFGTIDTRGWLIQEYGLDYLYENQKVYKAKKACPCACYSAGDKGLLGCDDIAAEPEKIEKRCRTQERVGVDATGREVRASIACKGVCRESCEGC